MIYEIRTYQIAPGSLAEVEKRFGDAYQYRTSDGSGGHRDSGRYAADGYCRLNVYAPRPGYARANGPADAYRWRSAGHSNAGHECHRCDCHAVAKRHAGRRWP